MSSHGRNCSPCSSASRFIMSAYAPVGHHRIRTKPVTIAWQMRKAEIVYRTREPGAAEHLDHALPRRTIVERKSGYMCRCFGAFPAQSSAVILGRNSSGCLISQTKLSIQSLNSLIIIGQQRRQMRERQDTPHERPYMARRGKQISGSRAAIKFNAAPLGQISESSGLEAASRTGAIPCEMDIETHGSGIIGSISRQAVYTHVCACVYAAVLRHSNETHERLAGPGA